MPGMFPGSRLLLPGPRPRGLSMLHEQSVKTITALAAESRTMAAKRNSARSAVHAERNLAIFKKVVIEHYSHDEVARRYGLRRSRVSQIVKQVRIELAQAADDDP